MSTLLSSVEEILKNHGALYSWIPASEHVPYEHLYLPLEETATFPKEALEIRSISQLTTSPPPVSPYALLQFELTFSLAVPQETLLALSTALHFFNRFLLVPGFELDEIHDRIVYRYVWFVKEEVPLDPTLLVQLIGTIELAVKMFYPHIQGIAKGEHTLEQILEQTIHLFDQQSS